MESRWDHIISLATSWVSTLLNQYTYWSCSINFSRSYTSILGPFCSHRYLCHSLYTVLMVETFLWSWSLIVKKIWPSFTMFLVIWLRIFFSSLLKRLAYACLTNVLLTLWLWTPKIPKSFQPICLTNFPFNLNEQSHFLVLVFLRTNLSLYWLYVHPFSQPTTT